MKILATREIRQFINSITVVLIIFTIFSELSICIIYKEFSIPLLIILLLLGIAILAICFLYFDKQHKIMENAVFQIQSYLNGNTDARIDCNNDGQIYRLFHEINTLATVLNAHAANELRDKEFLKNTILDISHQLKTPLAALNIYNGLLQDEAEEFPEIKEFAVLSEQELDRMETLVKNLLKITQLDTKTIEFKKSTENVFDIINDIKLHFAYRARQEHKKLILSGDEHILFVCDRYWIIEAISNIVKNAFDHTDNGDSIKIEWKQFASVIQIKIKDTGCGIHPEDLHYIFKRFYRSRFSKDTQGIGLGLPLAKGIIEAHNGVIKVDSKLGIGTTFIVDFLIPTKL